LQDVWSVDAGIGDPNQHFTGPWPWGWYLDWLQHLGPAALAVADGLHRDWKICQIGRLVHRAWARILKWRFEWLGDLVILTLEANR
jgi:hypothetical protein